MKKCRGLVAVALVLASTMTLAQQGPTAPFATMADRAITLHPSGATLQIPEAVRSAETRRSGGLLKQFTTYLSRPELEKVRNVVAGDEWDGPYSSILNVVLTFDACAVHFGTEPFGPGSGSFGDLQTRAYVVDGPVTPIVDRIATDGLNQAKGKERFPDAAVTTASPAGAWTLTTLSFTMNRSDYRAPGRMDFYMREFGKQTVVLVFMHSTAARQPWAGAVGDIVGSFTWPRF